MPRYKVTDPKGVLVGTERIPKGDYLPPSVATGAQLNAWKRFGQVQEIETKEPKAPADPPTDPNKSAGAPDK